MAYPYMCCYSTAVQTIYSARIVHATALMVLTALGLAKTCCMALCPLHSSTISGEHVNICGCGPSSQKHISNVPLVLHTHTTVHGSACHKGQQWQWHCAACGIISIWAVAHATPLTVHTALVAFCLWLMQLLEQRIQHQFPYACPSRMQHVRHTS